MYLVYYNYSNAGPECTARLETTGLYSPTVLKNVLSFVLQICLYLAALILNVTQLLIGLTIWFTQSEVVLYSNLQNLGDKDKERS